MGKVVPVFIGGCPRSGTTMLASLLGKHHSILVTPESQFKEKLINSFPIRHKEDLINIINYLEKNFRFNIWDIAVNRDELYENLQLTQYNHQTIIRYLLDEYNKANEVKNYRYWIDHTPENIKNAISLYNHFDNCKFIHIVRDGRAIANSLKKVSWGGNSTMFTSKYWMEHIAYGLALEKFLPNSSFMQTRYEDIILRPNEELHRICSFIGIEYDERDFDGSGFKVPVYTKKQHQLVGKEISQSRINLWETDLSEREIQIFEEMTNDLLIYLGYELKYPDVSLDLSLNQKLAIYAKEFILRGIDRFKHSRRKRKVNNS